MQQKQAANPMFMQWIHDKIYLASQTQRECEQNVSRHQSGVHMHIKHYLYKININISKLQVKINVNCDNQVTIDFNYCTSECYINSHKMWTT